MLVLARDGDFVFVKTRRNLLDARPEGGSVSWTYGWLRYELVGAPLPAPCTDGRLSRLGGLSGGWWIGATRQKEYDTLVFDRTKARVFVQPAPIARQ